MWQVRTVLALRVLQSQCSGEVGGGTVGCQASIRGCLERCVRADTLQVSAKKRMFSASPDKYLSHGLQRGASFRCGSLSGAVNHTLRNASGGGGSRARLSIGTENGSGDDESDKLGTGEHFCVWRGRGREYDKVKVRKGSRKRMPSVEGLYTNISTKRPSA